MLSVAFPETLGLPSRAPLSSERHSRHLAGFDLSQDDLSLVGLKDRAQAPAR